MKRIILLLFSGLTTISAFSQLNGDGYYRIQNTSSYARYFTISNDKIDETSKNAIKEGREGKVFGLRTIKNPVSDPSSIIYISKDKTSSSNHSYNFQAQGIDPLYFLKNHGAELRVYPTEDNYFIYGIRGAITMFMVDNNGSDGYILAARRDAYPQNQTWKFISLNTANSYFGITPDEETKIGDKYYTSLYASFPFKLGNDMKAYYVRKANLNSGNPIAELIEIKDIIPAATPVIIECSSLNPSDNKVELLDPNTTNKAISDNQLKGVYFCYYKAKGTDTSKENTQKEYLEIKNVVNYDSNKMRVLGVKDGKLALIDATDNQLVVTDQGRYLPANKAYFPITATVASATANGIILLDSETYETGINNIKTDEFNEKKRGVYTLSGIKASENNNLENLPKGIYIINGKKIVK